MQFATGTGVAQNWTTAKSWFERAAKRGHTASQFKLGHMFRSGDGVPRNGAVAVEWYERAADSGYGAAMLSLAIMYDAAEAGIARDMAKAVAWYEKAAAKGQVQACRHLAATFLEGDGVAQDAARGLVWLVIAVWAGEKVGYPDHASDIVMRDRFFQVLPPEQRIAIEATARTWVSTHW